MSWIGLHKLADIIFGITQKPFYITSSNLVRQYITNKGIFLNLFCNVKSDWSLVPGSFYFSKSCPVKETELKKKKKLTFFKGFLIILFENILFLKEFFACNGCLGLFIKTEKGFWTIF